MMSSFTIPPSCFAFLSLLKQHNEREWFAANKTRYLSELGFLEQFAEQLLGLMNTHDVIETPSGRKSLHRIYRDVRFSKDKSPYHTHWGGGFKRAGRHRRGSYYFHLSPGHSFAAGGFWGPNPADLKQIREELSFNPEPMRRILADKIFIRVFGTLQGDQIKTTPRGFDPSDPSIDLLRYRQFLLIRPFTDHEVTGPGFLRDLNETYRGMRPFLDYMSEALSGDGNGEVQQ